MLIIDTGVLVSIADTTDPHHDACATLLRNETEPLVTTAMVIAETAYLLDRDRDLGPRAEALLYQMILDDDLHIDALTIEDWQRVHDLVTNTPICAWAAPTPASSPSPNATASSGSPPSIAATSASYAPPTSTSSRCCPVFPSRLLITGRPRSGRPGLPARFRRRPLADSPP